MDLNSTKALFNDSYIHKAHFETLLTAMYHELVQLDQHLLKRPLGV